MLCETPSLEFRVQSDKRDRGRLKKLARDYDIFRQPANLISGPDMARWRDKRLKEVSASSGNAIGTNGTIGGQNRSDFVRNNKNQIT